MIVRFFDDEPICASDDVTIETTENMTSLKIGAAKRWHCGEFRSHFIFVNSAAEEPGKWIEG